MPLDTELTEVVSILTRYFLHDFKSLIDNYGDQAPSLAEEMATLLGEHLNSQTPYGSLWDAFSRAPVANEAELMGVLEVLEEADPEVTIRLQGYYAAFEELDQPGVSEVIETSEPEDTIDIPEVERIRSTDDMDNNDEYREDNEYLRGNVEDHSTSAMYYEGQDTTIEPNQTEEE